MKDFLKGFVILYIIIIELFRKQPKDEKQSTRGF